MISPFPVHLKLVEFSDQFSQLCRVLFVGSFFRNDLPGTDTSSRRLIALTRAAVLIGREKLRGVHAMLLSADWGAYREARSRPPSALLERSKTLPKAFLRGAE
jgi:hypothetical protein